MSDIFKEFVKIVNAQDKEKARDYSSSKAKKKLDKNPRGDSMSIKDIEKLYNVLPAEKHIMEIAHPEPVVLVNSYDKINGLVENNIERQNIILNILDKKVDGRETYHKYAKQEMVQSLVRVANDMDNKDEEDLRILADECLNHMVKQAAFPLVPVAIGIGAAAAALGAIRWWNTRTRTSEGVSNDCTSCLELANDIKEALDEGGKSNQYLDNFINKLETLKAAADEYSQRPEINMNINIKNKKAVDFLRNFYRSPQGRMIKKMRLSYKKALLDAESAIKFIMNSSMQLQRDFNASKSWIESAKGTLVGNKAEKLLGKGGFVFALLGSMKEAHTELNSSIKEQTQKAIQDLEHAQEELRAQEERDSGDSDNSPNQRVE